MLATIVRQASIDETAAEMDRRGKVIEELERRLTLRDTFICEKGLWHEFATTKLPESRAAPKIAAIYVCPPGPYRRADWCAFYEGEEEAGNYGWGPTEAAAIQDFIDNCKADHDERLGIGEVA